MPQPLLAVKVYVPLVVIVLGDHVPATAGLLLLTNGNIGGTVALHNEITAGTVAKVSTGFGITVTVIVVKVVEVH